MKDITDGAIAGALGWAGSDAAAVASLMENHGQEAGEQLISDVRAAIKADRTLNAVAPLNEPQLLFIVRQYATDNDVLEQVALDVARATTTATVEQALGEVQPAVELPPVDRLNDALERAKEAFWATLSASYPEIKTGDIDPFIEQQFDTAAVQAGTDWIEINTAPDNDDGLSM